MSEKLSLEIIGDIQTTLADVEIALNKARLMVEGILDETEQDDVTKNADAALMFAAQQNLLNTQAQIAQDYLSEIQSLIDRIQS